ncbi:MAG: carboxymuconolactone decarboxylase family protein [Duncaniella sp.]|nr:carboxymuconolactone decarboxylase family protein [Duncaniella sp.]
MRTVITRITIVLLIISAMTSNHIMAQQKTVQPLSGGTKVTQTAGRDQLGDFAPEFARLNDDILFGEVWSRNDLLSLRGRSLVTITSLISQGITDSSLTYHLQEAKKNGITRSEIAEILTHLSFYAGWPKAWAAFRLAKDVWNDDIKVNDVTAAIDSVASQREEFARSMIFPIGEPNTAYAKYFTGNSYLAQISDAQITFANVTFEPGCRNNWHIHKADNGGGQMLVGVAGRGWYQEEGKPAVEILPGSVIHIPANVKHWHGAAKDSWFAHLAFSVPGENTENIWLEPVTDEEYNEL